LSNLASRCISHRPQLVSVSQFGSQKPRGFWSACAFLVRDVCWSIVLQTSKFGVCCSCFPLRQLKAKLLFSFHVSLVLGYCLVSVHCWQHGTMPLRPFMPHRHPPRCRCRLVGLELLKPTEVQPAAADQF
jgi:hypothetical protein